MNNYYLYGTITKINPKGRITMPIISVILPLVSDKSKLARFCTSLFSCSLDVELIICSADKNALSVENSDKIKVVSAESELAALNSAILNAQGKFIVLSDEGVTFSNNALEKMIVASKGNSAACNVGLVSSSDCNKAYRENFSFDELPTKPYVFNHLLSADVIKSNALTLCGTDAFSLMLFIADYYRYDNCNIVNEVLVYTDGQYEYSKDTVLAYVVSYAEVFALTQNVLASMFFLSVVFNALLTNLNNESFEVLKTVTGAFKEDFALIAWIRATFGVDTTILCDENSSLSDFKNTGTGVFYKEVTLPVTADSIIRNFYFGKFGIDVLKKCIGAWGYYKFYRMKDGPVKKYGCMICQKLLGGDIDA